MFDEADSDRNGTIDKEELAYALAYWRESVKRTQAIESEIVHNGRPRSSSVCALL